jgi:nicotinamide-nucleotide amidase
MSDSEGQLTKRAEEAAQAVVHKLKAHSLKLALSESCTAGLVSSLLAGISGASEVLWGSFVCYTQEAKVSMLGLDNGQLTIHGLVSAETARAMAAGALEKSGADIAAAVTGLAGPLGDGSSVPVGTVWIAAAKKGEYSTEREFHFTGGRNEVRLKAAIELLEIIDSILT